MRNRFGYVVCGVVESAEEAIALRAEIDQQHDIPAVYLTAYADEDTLKRAKATEPFRLRH